ncbi:Nucleotidyltransferase domain-containing protein [Desulfonema limicola]|uniref:Nucleotidyltransferase domain-containing protein n=1 Tax=Desulfonema limicola TaxID=45656 RepID=A0A975B9H7_9BACT|nr:nucleotidyltransferase family protein [Desulfonema limicola]QTA81137.1 Nucleotidyltransferase domain-containing protein [Desulfonema limicola]
MQQKQIINVLMNLKEDADKQYKATLKGIFGSYARGEAKEDSDIDILVEFRKNATLLDLAGLGNFLEEKLQHKVDLVSQNAVREEIKPYLYSEIIYL